MIDVPGCLACDLSSGRQPLPGGRIFESNGWFVEHCIGPLGVGTLVLKPRRHVERFADLTHAEAAAFGPMVRLVTRALGEMLAPDQTYVCQWAHAGWTPGHIHFVIQPSWDAHGERYERPGPFLQVAMFETNEPMDTGEIEGFCERAREVIRRLATEDEVTT